MVVDPTLYQLCQAQMNLLVQSLGVTAGGVYWAEGDEQSPQWMPISVYPDSGWNAETPALKGDSLVNESSPPSDSEGSEDSWVTATTLFDAGPGASKDDSGAPNVDLRVVEGILGELHEEGPIPGSALGGGEDYPSPADTSEHWTAAGEAVDLSLEVGWGDDPEAADELGSLLPVGDRHPPSENYPLWRPLTAEGSVLGLLVLERLNRPWSLAEQQQVAEVVTTLESAFVLVKRQRWLEGAFADQEQFYEVQRDRLHDLLHQFKNPLTAIRTFGKLLARRFQGDEQATKVTGHVLRESDRLQGMLKSFGEVVDLDPMDPQPEPAAAPSPMLLPGSIEEPTAEQDIAPAPLPLLLAGGDERPVNLGALLEERLTSAQLLAQEANIALIAPPVGPLPTVAGDHTPLQEIVGNVIDNALKYTPAGGQVMIQVAVGHPWLREPAEEGQGIATVPRAVEDALLQRAPNSRRPQPAAYVAILVRDSGLGISAADLQQLFTRRFRGEKGNSDIPGTGLGLAIVRDTLEALGGAIEVFSPAIALKTLLANTNTNTEDSDHRLAPFTLGAIPGGTSVILWMPVATDITP